ncbi:MAG: UvrD-helicase domain-containing protein [Bacteriovoracaceae bacterium]|jgi:ATP-dependent exoDNAse (exonuclease V) beta subunit|nr:UvrD-helicase domain-containing protein [Bacteriovoracaceae bacterium]
MGTSANAEQLKAIEHNGGVLLSAGAGSGKTFVLKEHILYLTKNIIDKTDKEELEKELVSFFKQTILMTFTKKAAGELAVRISTEFEEFIKNYDEEVKNLVLNNISKLTITTIHGFCFKLIKEGFFNSIDPKTNVISFIEFKNNIRQLYDHWFELNYKDNEFVLKDRENIFETCIKIFSDPLIRYAWNENKSFDEYKKASWDALCELVEDIGYNDFVNNEIDLDPSFEGKKWYDFLCDIGRFKETLSIESFCKLNSYFRNLNYKIPVTPRAKGVSDETKAYYGIVKELNQFFKKSGDDLALFFEKFDDTVIVWFKTIKSCISYIEENYNLSEGITFSDLEYYTFKGLQNPKIKKLVSTRYKYLIVDEFQDTSTIQYDIIKSIVQDDLNRIFCVGDPKQAIYGFRGGELAVFNEASINVPQNLSLKNNYRSKENIIHFNNVFFENIFSKGLGFSGKDRYAVEVEYQEAPLDLEIKGHTHFINISASQFEMESLSNDDVENLEALAILESIKNNESQNIAILYKKLKPSKALMSLFMDNNIGFTAQVKVPFSQDPIIGLFFQFVHYQVNIAELKNEFFHFMMDHYLLHLGVTHKIEWSNYLDKFEKNKSLYGAYQSFQFLLSELGIYNSNYQNNLDYISNICSLNYDDFELIYEQMSKAADSYSLDFEYGGDSSRIQIMTAHASKGLEFEDVYIGGIYTNSKAMPQTDTFGKYPFSFKWSDQVDKKKKYKTPLYFLEQKHNSLKEYAESKRLFYVAGTRAKTNLYFVNIQFDDVKFRKQSNSWYEAIVSCTNDLSLSELKAKEGNQELKKFELKKDSPILFHKSRMGIESIEDNSKMVILPELSVTRLALLYECPKRFYLQNILKLDEVEDLKEKKTFTDDSSISSSERGTLIHENISKVILSGFSDTVDILAENKWTVENLKNNMDNFEYISEKPIKFPLFNFMISGIPDLVCMPKKDNDLEIWDFKTGRVKNEDDSSYHFQLYCYAYAMYSLNLYPKQKDIKIVLCYIDDKKIVDKTISFEFVNNYLFDHMSRVNESIVENTNNCTYCPYLNICQ